MNPGRIHILSKIRNEPWGGGNQFLKALIKALKEMGAYEEEPLKADAIVFNSYPFGAEELFKAAAEYRKRGKTIVHRVAGPFIVVRGSDASVDAVMSRFNAGFVDGTIFQSSWSREQWNKVGIDLGTGPGRSQATILNAPDGSVFHAGGTPKAASSKIRIIASSWSANPRKGFHFLKHIDENLDFGRYAFTFVGNAPLTFKNIVHIKPLGSSELAEELRRNDIYFSGSMNDSCPKALIEAMHCGLPAVALRSGGQPEIVGRGGELFSGTEDLIEAIEKVGSNPEGYRGKISLPDMAQVARSYLDFCLSIKKPEVPGFSGRAELSARYFDVKLRVGIWKLGNRVKHHLRRLVPK
jgi:hypothetical protein